MAGCLENAPDAEIAGVALSTQRESVVGWQASTGAPLGPVIGWQDRRTANWCNQAIDDQDRKLVHARTGCRVDPMFSAPKMRWLLDHLPTWVPIGDVRLGTVDSWLIWRLTGGAEHLCEAGNASRTLLYDITELDWSNDCSTSSACRPPQLPAAVVASDQGFGMTSGVPLIPDGTPVLAVLADSHAALFGHGCTEVGTAKATYGTGSSVMAPVAELSRAMNEYRRLWPGSSMSPRPTPWRETSCPPAPRWRGQLICSPTAALPTWWLSPRRCPTVAASLWFLPSLVWVHPIGTATPMHSSRA